MRTYVRHLGLLLTISIMFTSLALRAQKADSAAPTDKDFLPAGPFLFEPGTVHPTYLDAFDTRPLLKSPDGKLGVTVTGPRESYEAWVTISPSTFPNGPVQVWPIQASVDVLWRPDSGAFALTDNRYADHSFALVFGTRFRIGEDGPGLGVPITDLTPIVQGAFDEHARKYYGSQGYDSLLFYAKVLRWIGSDCLLVGLDARTYNPQVAPPGTFGNKEWFLAYIIAIPGGRVIRELDEGQLLSEYGIKIRY